MVRLQSEEQVDPPLQAQCVATSQLADPKQSFAQRVHVDVQGFGGGGELRLVVQEHAQGCLQLRTARRVVLSQRGEEGVGEAPQIL